MSSTALARTSAAAALLAVLPVVPALAQSYGASGGDGGFSFATGTGLLGGNGGDAATSSTPTAGGNAGAGNASYPGGAGGAAGTSGSPDGGDVGVAAGGGGGGGGGGYSNTSSSTTIGGDLTGGNGGDGGVGVAGGGGGGGAGGDGLISTATNDVSIANGVTIRGGNGGVGGSSPGGFNAGAGGTGSGGAAGGPMGGNTNGDGGGGGGGAGIVVTTTGITLTNSGTVSGGNGGGDSSRFGGGGGGGAGVIAGDLTIINNGTISGGGGGSSGNFISSSNPVGGGGDGGAGIIGSNLVIINSGTISGGAGAPNLGGVNGNAITLTGGVNSLELRAGSVINGNVVGATGAGTSNTLILGGAANAAFDVSAIGGQYQNFTAFQKTGPSTWTLTGTTNAVTPWTLSAGTLSISNDGVLGASGGGLTFNGGTLNTTQSIAMTRATTLNAGGGTFDVDSGTTLTMGGMISGNGNLNKTNAGTLTLSANNTYSGGTTISAGTLSISSNNNLGTGALTFNGGALNTTQSIAMTRAVALNAGGGTFDVDSGTTLTMSGTISGNGSLTKTDAGTLTLSANNTYSGGTTISAGTLSISSNNNLGTGALTFNGGTLNTAQNTVMTRATTLNGGGTFDVNSGTTLAMGGVISGNGSLTKTNAGTLTLSANNTYSGGTTISAGTLSISSNNNLGTGALTFDGGTLNATQTIAMTRAITMNGGGTFDVDAGVTLTVNGAISGGAGITKTDTGTLTLTGANNGYTGSTAVNAGTLALSGAGSIVGSSVTVDSGAIFDISATTNGASIKSLFGAGEVALGGRTLTLMHPDPSFSSFSGEITGTGGLTLNARVLFLRGANTYTGATTINSGSLTLYEAGSIADSSGVSIASGARFDIDGTPNGASIKSLSGGGAVTLGSQTLTLTNASGTFSGAFTGTFGMPIPTGGLTLSSTNTGTQTLTGANNSVGAVTVGGGTLAFGQNGVFNATSYETQSGAATTIAATAQLGVGGAFTQNVGSTLNIAVGSSNTPAITADTASLGGTLNIAGIGSESQLPQELISTANGISGDFGSVSIGGFVGTVDYFTVHTGKSADATKYLATHGLSWTANNSLAHGTFTLTNTADSFNVGVALGDQAANSVTGWDGKSLTKAGAGTLILSAANTYTGGTTITGGVLQLGDGVNAGSILGNVSTSDPNDSTKFGTLVFNQPNSTTFSGVISGSGSVIKNGADTLMLSGVNTYTGATTVDAGTLAVNGSIATSSLLTVNAGSTLGGNGTVGNTIINGGALAPGNSIGALTVAGNLVFTPTASYMVEVSPASADLTNVTGTATLGGAIVNATFAPGTYVAKQYTIISAGSVNGTFSSLVNTNLPSGFKTSLSYDATHAYLDLALSLVPPSGSLNTNQQNVGHAIINFFNSNGSIPIAFGSLTPAGLTQLSGELGSASQQTTFNAMNQFLGVMTDPFIAGRGVPVAPAGAPNAYAEERMAYAASGKGHAKSERDAFAALYTKAPAAPSFEQRWHVWAAGFGGSQQTDGSTAIGSNNTTSRLYGIAVGADYRFSPDTLAGFAIAGGGTHFTVANNPGSGRSDLFQAGAFIRHDIGPAYLMGALAYGWQDIVTDRTVAVAGVDRLRAEFNANAWSGRLEGGYRFIARGVGLTPYAAGQFTTFDLPSNAEQATAGNDVFALAYNAKTVTDTRSELGLRTDKSFAAADGITTLRGRLAWVHDFNPDRSIGTTFQALPGASFVINGAAQAADAALVTAAVEKKWLTGWSAAATFEGEFSNVARSYAGKGMVRYAW